MLTPEVISEVNALLTKKLSADQIQEGINAARTVYEKHMGKFPPVPDAVFLEIIESTSAVAADQIKEKLGISAS